MNTIQPLSKYINVDVSFTSTHLDLNTLVLSVISGKMSVLEMNKRIEMHNLLNSSHPLSKEYYKNSKEAYYKFKSK